MAWYRLPRSGIPYFRPGRPPAGVEVLSAVEVPQALEDARRRIELAETVDLAEVEAAAERDAVEAGEDLVPVGDVLRGGERVADGGELVDRPAVAVADERPAARPTADDPGAERPVGKAVEKPVKRRVAGSRVDGGEAKR